MRVVDDVLSFCTGQSWQASYAAPLGSSRGDAAPSCQAIADAGDYNALGKGKYWLYFNVAGLVDEEVYIGVCNFVQLGNGAVTGTNLGG